MINENTVKRKSGTLTTCSSAYEPPRLFSFLHKKHVLSLVISEDALPSLHKNSSKMKVLLFAFKCIISGWYTHPRTGKINLPRLKPVISSLHVKFSVLALMLLWKLSDLKLLVLSFFYQGHWVTKVSLPFLPHSQPASWPPHNIKIPGNVKNQQKLKAVRKDQKASWRAHIS